MKRSKKVFATLGLTVSLLSGLAISASAMSSTIAAYEDHWYSQAHAYYFITGNNYGIGSSCQLSAVYQGKIVDSTGTFYDNGNGSYQSKIVYGGHGVNTYDGEFFNTHWEFTSDSVTK